jgi:hypothetical protein
MWQLRGRHPLPLVRAAPRLGRADSHQSPDSFIAREGDEDLDVRGTPMWCHISKAEQPRWRPPITEFAAAAVEECPGTHDYRVTHLC